MARRLKKRVDRKSQKPSSGRRGRQRRPISTVEALETRVLPTTLVQVGVFDLWDGGVIRSTDAAGITYHAPSGHLYISDSEINEISEFEGNDIFETSLSGDRVYQEFGSDNGEPTGITYNEFDGFFSV